MVKKVCLCLFIFSLLLFSSCDNMLDNVTGLGENELSFELGESIAGCIKKVAVENKEFSDDTELVIECQLLRGDAVIKKDSVTVALKELGKAGFNFEDISNGNNYFVDLKVYFKDYLIYEALSDEIILNELNKNVSLNLNLVQQRSKIEYELNGGDISYTKIPTEYFVNSNTDIPEPIKEKAVFDGWYLDSGFTSEKITNLGAKKFLGNVKLYAKWIDIHKVASVDIISSNGADKVDNGDVITISCKTPGAQIYYTTDGTEPEPKAGGLLDTKITISKDTFPDNNFTIKAIAVKDGMMTSDLASKNFTINCYTVSFDTKDSNLQAPATITGLKKGDILTDNQLVKLDKADYEFLGWKFNGVDVKAGYEVTGNMVLTPNWREFDAVADVSFSLEAGDVEYGSTVTLSTETPEATIYYTTDKSEPLTSSNKITYTGPIAITKDTTINAIATKVGMKNSVVQTSAYTIKTYTVTFDIKGHGTLDTAASTVQFHKDEVFAGSKKLPVLSQDGYKFDGWCKDTEATTVVTESDKMGTAAITLYAKWTPVEGVKNVSAKTASGKITLSWTNPTSYSSQIKNIEVSGDNGFITQTTTGAVKSFTVNAADGYYYKLKIKVNYQDGAVGCVVPFEQRLYCLTSSPIILKDYTSYCAPTIDPPASYGKNGGKTTWTYVGFGDAPQTEKAANVQIDSSSNDKVLGFTDCKRGDDGYFYVDKVDKKGTYYRLEPVKWRVLTYDYTDVSATPKKGCLLYAENIFKTGNFGKTVDYANSDAKTYMNEFVNEVFDSNGKNKIQNVTLDNSFESTLAPWQTEITKNPKCTVAPIPDNTAFILNTAEITKEEYGFKSTDEPDDAKYREQTFYNIDRYLFRSMLRSPNHKDRSSSPITIVGIQLKNDVEYFKKVTTGSVLDGANNYVPAIVISKELLSE